MIGKENIVKDGKRYITLARHLKENGGRRIVKIPLSSGCTCPNRDGTKGVGGCTFCTGKGGGEFVPDLSSLSKQYEAGLISLEQKWKGAKKVAYFQAFSNTYCSLRYLRELLDKTLLLPDVSGIRIATRADCLSDEIVDVLAEFSKRTEIGVELGLQTANDITAKRINRCHTTAEFEEGYEKLKAKNIPVCVHIINGLPGETREDMLATARFVGRIRPQGIKIHMLHILRGSRLGEAYEKEPFELLSREEYVDIVCSQIELLSPYTVIERLTGDGDKKTLLAPDWTKNKRDVLNAIDKELVRRDTWQGRLWEG